MIHIEKITLLGLFVFLWFTAVTQSVIHDGYVVFNKQLRTGCLIRNSGSEGSTMHYQYKLKKDQEFKKIELSKIEEFGINHMFKCVRALIAMDVSDDRISEMKDTLGNWIEGHAYIQVLVEGAQATLYSYSDEGKAIFLFRTGNTPVTTLIHKRYSLEVTPNLPERIFVNNTYQKQLKEHMPYGDPDKTSVVPYTKKALVKYFTDFQKEKQADYVVYQPAQAKKISFGLKIAISLNRINLGIQEFSDALPNALFSNEISPGYGIEAEFLLPFNNYGWSIFSEANYVSYHSDQIVNSFNPALTEGYSIDYKTVELPFGITRFFNINRDHRIFLRGAFVPNFVLSGSRISFKEDYHCNLSPSSRWFLGAGYHYRRIASELRYYGIQNISSNIYKRGSELSQISFRLSYALFRIGK